jgi:glutamate N-acetyltransferase/amino-acid N-acetyltransferase
MLAGIPPLMEALDEDGLNDAAEAIMTTDLFPKTFSRSVSIEGKEVTVTGLAKGAGMISPNMATMLAYIMTDADIDADTLQHALEVATNVSFNCITVDGDMSTNDTVIALASGESAVDVKVGTTAFEPFLSTLKEVMIELARMIVRDGEGATKLIEIRVTGAETDDEAKKAACKVANSPLVKTAFYGEDANWGRIAAAVGGAGITLDESRLGIAFNDVPIVENGLFLGKEAEAKATEYMKAKEITLNIAINLGACDATVWTCDLTHDYIRINAEYRS